MRCPECGWASGVIDSRANDRGIRRRRKCDNGHRFTTQEILLTQWHDELEKIVDEVMAAAISEAERVRDKLRNRNRA